MFAMSRPTSHTTVTDLTLTLDELPHPAWRYAPAVAGEAFNVLVTCIEHRTSTSQPVVMDVHRLRFSEDAAGWTVACDGHPDPEAELAALAFDDGLDETDPNCLNLAPLIVTAVDAARAADPGCVPWVVAEMVAATHAFTVAARGEPLCDLLDRADLTQQSGFRPWVWWRVDPMWTGLDWYVAHGHTPVTLAEWHRTSGPYGVVHDDADLRACLPIWKSKLHVTTPAEAVPWTRHGVNGLTLALETSRTSDFGAVPNREVGRDYQDRLDFHDITDDMIAETGLNKATYCQWQDRLAGHAEIVAYVNAGMISSEVVDSAVHKNKPMTSRTGIVFDRLLSMPLAPDPRLTRVLAQAG